MTLYKAGSGVTLLIEFGFGSGPYSASPTWTDLTQYGMGLQTFRGRQSVRAHFDAGSALITLDNDDGRFDPNNSSSPYFGNMRIGTPVRIRTTFSAVTRPLFRGSVTRWPIGYPLDGHSSVVQIEVVENLSILNSTIVTASYAEAPVDDRIALILDSAGWPGAWRQLADTSTLAAAQAVDGPALEAILQASDADAGHVFIQRDGDLEFQTRLALSGDASAATFNPGVALDYAGVDIAYDEDFLINSARITAVDGGVGTDSDATSIANHGAGIPFQVELDTLISAPWAQNLAEWTVDAYKDVAPRITALYIEPEVDTADLFPEVLGRELRDLITVVVNPPGTGSTLTQTVVVQGISHTVTADTWQTVYACHPAAPNEILADYWILNVSDDLGVDTRLA